MSLLPCKSTIDLPGSQPVTAKGDLLALFARAEFPPIGAAFPVNAHHSPHQDEMYFRLRRRAPGMILEVWDQSRTGGVIENSFLPEGAARWVAPYKMKMFAAGVDVGIWLVVIHGVTIILRVLIHPVLIDQLLEEEAL